MFFWPWIHVRYVCCTSTLSVSENDIWGITLEMLFFLSFFIFEKKKVLSEFSRFNPKILGIKNTQDIKWKLSKLIEQSIRYNGSYRLCCIKQWKRFLKWKKKHSKCSDTIVDIGLKERALLTIKCHFLGPALGSFLYGLGGFTLPFVVVGSIGNIPCICYAICTTWFRNC